MQWYGAILPRIKAHLPGDHILEIACGFGRWTNYLKDLCRKLTAIDLSDEYIKVCRQRFSTNSNLDFFVNNGKSLDMLEDNSVDFIFSFDSLFHADESVIDAYFSQFPRIMEKNGAAFIHHSNLGEYMEKYRKIRKIPKLQGLLKRTGILDRNLHWREPGVDAVKAASIADKYGLQCISQELVLWGIKKTFIDCISVIVKKDSDKAMPVRVFRNKDFMNEAKNLSRLSFLYGPSRFRGLQNFK